MTRILQRFQLRAGISLPALMLASGVLASGILGASSPANAQSANDAEVKALRAQVEALQKAVNQLTSGQQQSSSDAKAAKEQASAAQAKAAQAAADASKAQAKVQAANNANAALIPTKATAEGLEIDAQGHTYLQHKKGNPLTFYTPGGEITAYGNIDVSVDGTTKSVGDFGSGNFQTNGASAPIGNFGWLPAIASNASYLGVRGFQRLPNSSLNFIYQFELGYDISATPGLKQTNSQISDNVNGALFNRNTWVGFADPEFGAVKIGKTNAPYDSSTGGFNPFQGQIGDMRVIMGNTGGDNRVEFSSRLEHAIWYESPTIGGFQFNALFSPGQNRSDISDNIPAGSSDCTGGNDPLSGGLFPQGCNDGAFSNAVSTNLSYTNGGFYGTVAYERHFKVNRQSDISGIYGACAVGQAFTDCVNAPFGAPGGSFANATQLAAFLADVADEDAFKVAALYTFPTKTTVGGIFEMMHRYVSPLIQFQNERTRNGTWLFLTQELTQQDSVSFGWAHAFRGNGDPGQHNSGTTTTIIPGTDPAGGAFTASNDNQADMVTASYKRKFGPNLTWYTAVAATFNGPNAHYDLGAGGHGITTDCHDAFAASGGQFSIPHCFVGPTLAGVSSGLQWRF
jgi:predicted porin